MITLDDRPRLAGKVRLRYDRVSGQTMLLYPERGLALNATGAEIVKSCTGEHSVAEIIDKLSIASGTSDDLTGQVIGFLESLAERGLLRGLEP